MSEDRGAKGDDGWGEHQAGGPCHGDLYDGDGDDDNDNEDGGDGNGSNGDEDVKNETPGDGPDKGPARQTAPHSGRGLKVELFPSVSLFKNFQFDFFLCQYIFSDNLHPTFSSSSVFLFLF